MVITSASNEQIKYILRLREKKRERDADGCYLVEGKKMFSEIPGDDLVKAYASESFLNENKDTELYGNCQAVSDSVFRKISGTVTPQGILAVARKRICTLETLLDITRSGLEYEKKCLLILDRLQDPGNLGTIIRTAEGAGVSGVIISESSADIYQPKAVRATMGSIFRMPFVIAKDPAETILKVKKAGVTVYAADIKGSDCSKIHYAVRSALVIGNEASGISKEVEKMADRRVRIPMKGKVESLNAAVAAALLMYEIMK